MRYPEYKCNNCHRKFNVPESLVIVECVDCGSDNVSRSAVPSARGVGIIMIGANVDGRRYSVGDCEALREGEY